MNIVGMILKSKRNIQNLEKKLNISKYYLLEWTFCGIIANPSQFIENHFQKEMFMGGTYGLAHIQIEDEQCFLRLIFTFTSDLKMQGHIAGVFFELK